MGDDLVKLLRRQYGNLTGGERQAVADRIEALDAQLAKAAAVVEASGRKRGELEAKLAQAVETMESLIQLAHDCERELTEDLYHVDFCGESEPLTKARTTLAELKGQDDE
jgi:hypothetical protein